MPNLTTRRWLPALVAVALLAGACRPDQPAKTARLQDALPGMPLPNDPTFISRSGSDSALQIVLSSGQPPEAMINFYRGILSTAPWTLVSDQPFDSGGRVFYASRSGPPLWVTIKPNPAGAGSLISLNGAVASPGRDSTAVKPADTARVPAGAVKKPNPKPAPRN